MKEMKSVMQKSSEDHRKFLDDLEKTKQLKDVKKIKLQAKSRKGLTANIYNIKN